MKSSVLVRTSRIAALAALLACRAAPAAPDPAAAETPAQRDARMAWFNEAKFGMFIHWGLYAVPAGEHAGKTGYGEWFVEETKMPMSEYERFAAQFNPTNFDARAWVRIAKDAGMRYLCITSKHHDGFGLWNSKLGDWNIGRTPFRDREPLKELADACRAEGLRFCLYHSIMDWHHERYGQRRAYNDTAKGDVNMPEYVDYMKGQLRELVTGFGPVGILWFDGGWEKCWTDIPNHGPDLYDFVRGLQPDIIVNDRGGKGDYGTPEQTIPGTAPKTAWETCMTLNDHWGYNRNDRHWKSTTTLVRNLVDCASKGGNYLLNVGPTADGLIPFECVARLREVGDWMRANGEAVYGTLPGPFRQLDFGRATIKGEKLYLFVLDVPSDRRLTLPGFATPIRRAYLLADAAKQPLKIETGDAGPVLTLPAYPPAGWNEHANVVVCECDGRPEPVVAMIPQAADGSLKLPAKEAEVEGEGPAAYEQGDGKDNIGLWTSEKNVVTWTARLAKGGRFNVTIDYACPSDSAGSEFEISFAGRKVSGRVEATGDTWTAFTTKALGVVELEAGKLPVRVTPLSKPGLAVMNLRSIVLTPAAGDATPNR